MGRRRHWSVIAAGDGGGSREIDMKTISESKSSPRAISVIWGVLLTAVLMFGLALALVYAYRLALEVLS